jgi:hypothetical protein
MAGQVAIGNLLSRGITAIGREIAQLPRQLEDFAARGQEIARTASIVGSSAENWQRWAYAAKMTDTPVETLQNAMQKLNKNMAEFTVGKGSLKDIAKYGPPGLAKQIRSTHDTTEAMMFLADAVTNTKDAQLRAAIAQSAFGKAGQDMLPFLLEGRIEIARLTKEADKFEYMFGKKAIDASYRMDTALKHLRGSMDYLRSTVMATTMEALTPYIEKAVDWVSTHKDLIAQKIPEYIDKITEAAKWTWHAVESVVDIWKRLDNIANGHLARDIFLVVAAWKAVRLAIDLAKAAQIAFNIVAAATGRGGAGAAATEIGAGAAKWAARFAAPAAGAAGAAGLLGTVAAIAVPAAVLASVYYGASQYAKAPTAANLNPNNALLNPRAQRNMIASPSAAYMAGVMTPALAGALNQQAEAPNAGANPSVNVTVPVNVDNSRAPGVNSTVRKAPAILGVAGHQYAAGGAQ